MENIMPEKYQSTPEEIKKVEEMMTEKEKELSAAREEGFLVAESKREKAPEQRPEKMEIDPLLEETIYNESEKARRRENFEKVFEDRWHKKSPKVGKEGYFETERNESPFSQYSSRGWKIHIAFEKGKEKEMARFLYENGLYFKLEAGIGTYFDGQKESGATIYIGSNENMKVIAGFINEREDKLLKDGATAQIGDKKIHIGSGSDIEIISKITARFDVAKTQYGWLKGNKKYSEHGLPSWFPGLAGLPILDKHAKQVAEVVDLDHWNKLLPSQQKIYFDTLLTRVYNESKQELIKDFGEEFVLGKKK